MPTTFEDIWTAVMNRVRIPVTNTDQLARVKQIVNDVYRDICLHEDWYWLVKRHVFNTASAYDQGTITVTTGSTGFTFDTTPTALGSFVNRKLIVAGGTPDSLAVYRIETHTSGAATGLLDAAYTNTSSTGASFNVYQDEYDLPTDYLSLIDAQRYGYTLGPQPIGPRDMLTLKGRDTTRGKPQRYTVLDFDTTGDPTTQRQLWVHPYPDNFYRVEIIYRRQATELISAEDVPSMPEEFRHLLIEGALADAYSTMLADETRGANYRQRYEQGLARLAVQNREKTGQRAQLVPKDQHRGFFKGRRVGSGTMDLGSFFDRWSGRG